VESESLKSKRKKGEWGFWGSSKSWCIEFHALGLKTEERKAYCGPSRVFCTLETQAQRLIRYLIEM
jgi:hypothetical protein